MSLTFFNINDTVDVEDEQAPCTTEYHLQLAWDSEKLKEEGKDLAGAGEAEDPTVPHNNLVSQQTSDNVPEL